MLQQSWRRTVNWCNPPFALIPRVMATLRAQKASAAVVVPVGVKKRWSAEVRQGAAGVMQIMRFDPKLPGNKSSGLPPDIPAFKHDYAVVFLDFSTSPPNKAFCSAVSAESFPPGYSSSPTYSRLPTM